MGNPSGTIDDVILENLHTLFTYWNDIEKWVNQEYLGQTLVKMSMTPLAGNL